jgi:Tol biopolymer transport system component
MGFALLGLLTGRAGFAAGTLDLASRVDPSGFSDTGSGSGSFLPAPPAVSRDGRYVAFLSVANNLVAGQIDLNTSFDQSSDDVFLYDQVARTLTLVSHAADSPVTTGDAESLPPAISADGRWVLYRSMASNLVDGIPEFSRQARLFLWDRISGNTTLVSSSPALEDSGCGGCGVRGAAISGDGRWVAFLSEAPDLVPGQPDTFTNVFLYDRTTRRTVVVSRTGTPGVPQSLSLSGDGRFAAFDSFPADSPALGNGSVYLYDRDSDAATRIGPGSHPTISADGGSVAYLSSATQGIPGQVDANGAGIDVFLYSRAARTTVLVSHATGHPTTTGNGPSDPVTAGPFALLLPSLSADGRYVAFLSRASNLVPRQAGTGGAALFVFDRTTGTVTLASRAKGSPRVPSFWPQGAAMSADGRFLVFASEELDLVPGQTDFNYSSDIFLFDRKSEKTTLVSSRKGSPRTTGSGLSRVPTISADGSQIAFFSSAPDLVAGVRDLNSPDDLFLYSVAQRTNTVATLHAPGMASRSPDADSFVRGLSADGRWTLFEGGAANLAPGQVDLNGQSDVFLYDHATKTVTLVSHAASSAATAGDGPSFQATLSADGRFVAFTSYSTNLDPTVRDYSDPSTGQRRNDIFLFDRDTGKVTALSRSARHPGVTGDFDSGKPAISADGRWVAFMSFAEDLVPATDTTVGNVYLYDRLTGALKRANAAATPRGSARALTLSADGRYLAVLTPDRNGHNVYLYDRVAGTRTLVSHAPDGTTAGVLQDETPALSADGRFVAFTSTRSDLGGAPGGDLNVYLWDRTTGAVTLAGASDRAGRGFPLRYPHLSADGRWLVFLSNRSLVPGSDNPAQADQVYLYDRISGSLTLVSPFGGPLAISADGRYVVTGLSLYDRIAGTTTLLAKAWADDLLLSADGHSLAFQTRTPNLVPGDFNGVWEDVFLLSGVTP